MNFGQPIRALFSDIGSLYALDDRAWKKLGNGKISLIHNAYNPTKVLLSLETDVSEYVYQMKPKTKKKGQTWILKGDNTATNNCDILAVRFSDKNISLYFKKMLEKAAKLKKKHEQKHRRHHNNHNHEKDAKENLNLSGELNKKSEIFKPFFLIQWRCPLCKYMNESGAYKCNICHTPQSDLNIINSTQDQFVEIINIIQSSLTNHDRQLKLLNDLILLTKKLMKNDQTHKSLDLNNREIQKNLLSIRGVDRFLSCLGFVEDAPKKKLKCPEDKPHIYAVIAAQSVCKQCINQDSVRQIDEKRKENDGEIGLNKTRILDECKGSVKHCMSIRRVIYVLKYYKEFVQKKSENKSTKMEGGIYEHLMNNRDRFYSNALLINDMIHILVKHDSSNKEFEQLYNFTIKELGSKKCAMGKCVILQRNHRNRPVCGADNTERMKLYFGFNQSKEVNTQQIIDKVHCYILHSFDVGYKLNNEMKQKIRHKNPQIRIRELHTILNAKRKERVQCMSDCEYNRFVLNDSSGNGKGLKEEISSKYENLKEEMLENKCAKISNEQWLDLYERANDFMRCETLMDITEQKREVCEEESKGDNDSDMFEIYHIISVLLYCNFELLSHHLRSGNSDTQCEYANWAQILRHTVNKYGISVKNDAKNANDMYIITDKETLFDDFQLCFNGVTSVSSSYMIPYLYMNESESESSTGLILECQTYGLSFFICDFLSDFVYEKEKLLLGSAEQMVTIQNIVSLRHNYDYLYGIQAMQTISDMITAKPVKKQINDTIKQIIFKFYTQNNEIIKHKNIDEKDKKAIMNGNYEQKNKEWIAEIKDDSKEEKKEKEMEMSDINDNNEYYTKMIESHCDQTKEIRINLFLMRIDTHEINQKLFGYLPLKSLFMSDLYEGTFVKLDRFCTVFKNVQKVCIENINVSILKSQQKQQKTVLLSTEFMDNLLMFLTEKSEQIQLNEIIISNANEVKLSMNEAITVYTQQFLDINWIVCTQQKRFIFKRNRINKAKLKHITYANDKETYILSITLEGNESLIIEKSFDDCYGLYNQLSNEMNIKLETVLKMNNDNQELAHDLSAFYKELLIKCETNDSVLMSKLYNFLIV